MQKRAKKRSIKKRQRFVKMAKNSKTLLKVKNKCTKKYMKKVPLKRANKVQIKSERHEKVP